MPSLSRGSLHELEQARKNLSGMVFFRYGGWREGLERNSSVPAKSENTAVYFNNKVCKMIVMFAERNVSFVQKLAITRNGGTCDRV